MRLVKDDSETKSPKKKSISLSSLLNVINGVASHEGHVLIMTTNYLDLLDGALICSMMNGSWYLGELPGLGTCM